ncbi:MAG: hypothetical protein HY709_12215 [Candidatus Latescibacteria bacterium]|nr:hypothetical protein [Candidatus Latescibacterota bacterium]
MGGAYVAVAEDLLALFYNPAGLAQVRRVEFYGDLARFFSQSDTKFFGTVASDRLSNTRLSSCGLILPYPTYRGSLVFAGGFVRPFMFDMVVKVRGYDTIERFDTQGGILEEGWLGAYSFGFAVDVAPSLSLGAAINIYDGDDLYAERSTFSDTRLDAHPDTVSLFARRTFRDEYNGRNFTLGALIGGAHRFRVGVTIVTPVTYEVTSDFEDEFIDEYIDRQDVFEPAGFSYAYRLRHPFRFGLGVSCLPIHRLLIAGAVYSTGWPQTEYIEQRPPRDGELSDIPVRVEDFRQQYRYEVRYHIGGEFLIPKVDLLFRTGYYNDPVVFVGPRHLSEESSPKIDVVRDGRVITGGVGMLVGQVLDLNVAYAIGQMVVREGHRDEERTTQKIFWSTAYRF